MIVHLRDQKLRYVSVANCECTSLKLYFHEVTSGRLFPEDTADHVGQEIRTRTFAALRNDKNRHYEKSTIVRTSVARTTSTYRSKVVNKNCMPKLRTRSPLRPLGLAVEPSLSEFSRRIRTCMCVSAMIFRRFEELSCWLGRRGDWFTNIYDLSQVSSLREYINQRMGSTVALLFVNQSGA